MAVTPFVYKFTKAIWAIGKISNGPVQLKRDMVLKYAEDHVAQKCFPLQFLLGRGAFFTP